ncbi:hypothetical protein [Antarctobacter heliothermus]|uniref:Uncharacterized protein n=1 Tax=Antarctobacter heliothermus TaxID=74033 RepID=A0A239JQM6_9RHOB|nr:hypothetical protein SAMN04488078_105423 [Antarctobacter heliothermus]
MSIHFLTPALASEPASHFLPFSQQDLKKRPEFTIVIYANTTFSAKGMQAMRREIAAPTRYHRKRLQRMKALVE